MKLLSYLFSGIIFGVGLIVGGMTQPGKIVGFLDFFGNWDPSLIFVMGGAISVHALGYRLMTKQPQPVFAPRFQVPTRRDIDPRLVLGSAIFGAGWGLAGYCPGPALTSLATLRSEAAVFVLAMAAGMLLVTLMEKKPKELAEKRDREPCCSEETRLPGAPEAL